MDAGPEARRPVPAQLDHAATGRRSAQRCRRGQQCQAAIRRLCGRSADAVLARTRVVTQLRDRSREALAADGPLAHKLQGYVVRDAQAELSCAVADAIAQRATLLAEAG